MDVNIRWMIRRDLPEVINIENKCFKEFPWSEEDFLGISRMRNSIGMVCEDKASEKILGFIIYELDKESMTIKSMAVDPEFQRKKIGSTIIEKMKDKMSSQRRTLLNALVAESNLTAQLFFSKNGFQCKKIVRQPYDVTDEDGYLMKFSISREPVQTNRISDILSE